MRRLARLVTTLVIISVLAFLLARRTVLQDSEPPVAGILPDLAEYQQVDSQSLSTYIGALAEGAALVAAQPKLAGAIATVDQIAACYQDAGAAQLRLYSHRDRPLSAGVVAVANLEQLLDPETLLACAGPELIGQESAMGEPVLACTETYSLSMDNARYRILLAGTTDSVCHDLCSQLAGCSLADLNIAPVE
ncbi:MAG: hypothetical protein R3C44_08915 [Chloroflexota bacterium]